MPYTPSKAKSARFTQIAPVHRLQAEIQQILADCPESLHSLQSKILQIRADRPEPLHSLKAKSGRFSQEADSVKYPRKVVYGLARAGEISGNSQAKSRKLYAQAKYRK